MARKLRLEKGDFVIWKGRGESDIGRVVLVTQHAVEDRCKWGVFGYIIDWGQNTLDLSNEGWCIKDITEGGLKPVENVETYKVLYGKSDKV